MKQGTKGFRTLLALILALVMVAGNVMTVMAEEPYDEAIAVRNGEVEYPDGIPYPQLDGDLVVDESSWALEVGSSSTETEYTVTGDVSSNGTASDGYGTLEVWSEKNGSAKANIEGDVIATDDDGLAVNVHAEDKASATANIDGAVTGNVIVCAGDEPHGGLPANTLNEANASGNGPTATLTVGKNVDGTVKATVNDGGTVDVTIEDGVEAKDVTPENPYDYPSAVSVTNGMDTRTHHYSDEPPTGGTANITINGGIETDMTGVYSQTITEMPMSYSLETGTQSKPAPANTNIQITGDINVSGEATDSLMNEGFSLVGANLVSYGENAKTVFDMEGDINVASVDGNAFGVEIVNAKDGITEATVTGDVSATSSDDEATTAALKIYNGYDIPGLPPELRPYYNYNGGTVDVTVIGDVTATGGEQATGMDVFAKSSYHYTATLGDVFTGSPEGDMDVQGAIDIDGKTYILHSYTVEGKEPKYYAADLQAGKRYEVSNVEEVPDEVQTNVLVEGDVTADTNGIRVEAGEDSNANIIVNGTVKGDTAGAVLVGDTKLGKGLTLTVWKLEGDVLRETTEEDDGDRPVVPETEGSTPATTTAEIGDDEYREIQYIIRIKDDEDTKKAFKDLKGATGSIGRSDLGDDYKYIAKEDDTVTAIIEAPEGYEIVKAVANAEGVELTKVGEGKYQLTVKRGGGYEIAVTLKKLPDPEPDPEPEPEPDEPDEPDTVAITYILGNDTQYDHIRTTAAVGEGVALQPAPERDGYTFLYWQCTDVDPSSSYYQAPDPENDFQFRPGAIYTAKKDINFVAVWQKN